MNRPQPMLALRTADGQWLPVPELLELLQEHTRALDAFNAPITSRTITSMAFALEDTAQRMSDTARALGLVEEPA